MVVAQLCVLMAATHSAQARDAQDLFAPVEVVRKRQAGCGAPIPSGGCEGTTNDLGFASARQSYALTYTTSGKAQFVAEASTLPSPLVPEGPVVFWQVRDFYYRLGFDVRSKDLATWLRTPSAAKRTGELAVFFDMDWSTHLRPSRKQAQFSGVADEAKLMKEHDTEIMGSSAYIMILLLAQRGSMKKVVQANGHDMFTRFCSSAGVAIPVMVEGGEALPRCLAPRLCSEDCAQCVHMHKACQTLEKRFGLRWRETQHAEFLWTTRIGACRALDGLVYQVFWQTAQILESFAQQGCLRTSAEGVPVLRGAARTRRMTKVWLASPGFGVTTNAAGQQVLSASAPRTNDAIRLEGLRLSVVHATMAQKVERASHVALSPDCLSAPGETLNTLICLPLDDGVCGWLPVQDVYYSEM